MEGSSSSLLNIQRPFHLQSSPPLCSISLALPTITSTSSSRRRRGSFFIASSGDVPPSSGETKKPSGFGNSTEPKKIKKGGEGKERRSAVIRRSPLERPTQLGFLDSKEQGQGSSEVQQSVNESAFLLTWLGLGLLILVEGILLAASGFLPEEWDSFFVKYLYPSFTPTVFLFVGGTVIYGVVKYLQGENMKT